MRIFGTIKDAKKERPVSDAKISLFIRDRELAVLFSDSKGEFEQKEAASYLGETLICHVEKEGHRSQRTTYKIEQDELKLDIELVPIENEIPIKNEKIKIEFNVKDENGDPLKGVHITAGVPGNPVIVGITDRSGLFKILLGPDFKDKTLNYKAKLQGFGSVKGNVQLEKKVSLRITLKKAKFYKAWWIVGGLIALESIFWGGANLEDPFIVNNLVLIPLAACILAFIKPVDWVYAGLFAFVLQEIALLGYGLGQPTLYHYDLLGTTILVMVAAGVCPLISFLRLRYLKKNKVAGEV